MLNATVVAVAVARSPYVQVTSIIDHRNLGGCYRAVKQIMMCSTKTAQVTSLSRKKHPKDPKPFCYQLAAFPCCLPCLRSSHALIQNAKLTCMRDPLRVFERGQGQIKCWQSGLRNIRTTSCLAVFAAQKLVLQLRSYSFNQQD
eukprot:1434586-Pleurochrysis_carterae.AAC.2